MTETYKIPEGPEQMVKQKPLLVPHPGAFIRREVLDPFELSITEAAERMGIQRVGLSKVLSGKTSVSEDLAYKLEALTGIDADLIISWQVAHSRIAGAAKRAEYARTIERVKLPETTG